MIGVDIASTDGDKVDWNVAKAHGVGFAIVRADYGTWADPTFHDYWINIAKAGIRRGAYLFLRYPFHGTTPASPEDQANAFIKTLGMLQHTDIVPALDLEFPGKGLIETGMTPEVAEDWVKRAWAVLKAYYGVPPLLYTSARVWGEDLHNIAAGELAESELWLAHYQFASRQHPQTSGFTDPPVPPPWGDHTNWSLHQFQGDSIGLDGFSSTVDLSRFNPIVAGQKGDRVKRLQGKLKITQDGDFGPITAASLASYKLVSGLLAGPDVDLDTWISLNWVV